MAAMVNLSETFFKNLQAVQAGERLIVNQGGQGSSKTYSILQLLYILAKRSLTGLRITIASYALPHLKAGAITDFDRILTDWGESVAAVKNISSSTYYIGQSVVQFVGMEGNIAKAHGVRRDILFINECNRKITYEVYDQLASRTQGIVFLDFNPDMEFWLQEKVLPNFKHKLIVSTYLDNPWLPENERLNIESKRDKKGFENWWKVYGLGQLGKLEGAVFQNWRYMEDDEQWPTHLPYGFGLDFGFNAPDAMVRCAKSDKEMRMYWDECLYASGLTPNELEEGVGNSAKRTDAIVADSADARMIKTLRRKFNIKAVDKSKWTVSEGLRLMGGYEHIITRRSTNLGKEFGNYVWSDKKAGVPVDAFNHLIDGGRYYFMTNTTKSAQRWH